METVARRRGGNRKPQTFRDCAQCGERFGPLDRLDQRFCSYPCKVKAQKATPSAKRGRTYLHLRKSPERQCLACSETFRAIKDTHRRKQIYCSHHCYLRNRASSQFEVAVGDWMEARGIRLLRQVKFGRWTFDFALMGTMIVVEADGVYWHAGEKVQARDALKTAYCAEHGVDLVRVTDLDFTNSPARAMSVIVARWEAATGRKAVLHGSI